MKKVLPLQFNTSMKIMALVDKFRDDYMEAKFGVEKGIHHVASFYTPQSINFHVTKETGEGDTASSSYAADYYLTVEKLNDQEKEIEKIRVERFEKEHALKVEKERQAKIIAKELLITNEKKELRRLLQLYPEIAKEEKI